MILCDSLENTAIITINSRLIIAEDFAQQNPPPNDK